MWIENFRDDSDRCLSSVNTHSLITFTLTACLRKVDSVLWT